MQTCNRALDQNIGPFVGFVCSAPQSAAVSPLELTAPTRSLVLFLVWCLMTALRGTMRRGVSVIFKSRSVAPLALLVYPVIDHPALAAVEQPAPPSWSIDVRVL